MVKYACSAHTGRQCSAAGTVERSTMYVLKAGSDSRWTIKSNPCIPNNSRASSPLSPHTMLTTRSGSDGVRFVLYFKSLPQAPLNIVPGGCGGLDIFPSVRFFSPSTVRYSVSCRFASATDVCWGQQTLPCARLPQPLRGPCGYPCLLLHPASAHGLLVRLYQGKHCFNLAV